MDVLSDILDLLQLKGTLYFRTAFTPPWSVAVPEYSRAARFHIAAQGRCHVQVGDSVVVLDSGDMIVIPNGAAHVLSDGSGVPAEPLDDVLQETGYSGEGALVWGGDTAGEGETKLICGHFDFATGADHPLLRALPDYLHVTGEARARASWLDEIVRLITRQVFAGSPGVGASVIRLSEALFIEVVRACAERDPRLHGLIEAMEDPRIGRALSLMHREPERAWSLDRLAREVGMSRSRFAERFNRLVGCAPMSYLLDIRLQAAMNLLSGGGEPVKRVAERVGYQSAAAFSRAFAQRFGYSPRDVRRPAA
jgi:AraC-like DNA-binding protein